MSPLVPLVLSQRLPGVGHCGEKIQEGHAQYGRPEVRWSGQDQIGRQDTPRTDPLQGNAPGGGMTVRQQMVQAGMAIIKKKCCCEAGVGLLPCI